MQKDDYHHQHSFALRARQNPLPFPDRETKDKKEWILNRERSVRPDTLSFRPLVSSSSCRSSSSPITNYRSADPRLFDSPRAMSLQLDRPPLQSSHTQPVNENQLFSSHPPSNSNGGVYPSYASIYNGDITYYTDISNDSPFSSPAFFLPSYTNPTLFEDPMGSRKPCYQRIPLCPSQKAFYDYSFDRDQCEFREDLMSRQQTKNLYSDFGAYHMLQDPYPNYFPQLPQARFFPM